MSAWIIKQGILDTIQDNGRFGHQHNGINPGGAMDTIAASIANILAGNKRDAPIIELHFPAATFQFTTACIIALSGGDFAAAINDECIPLNTAVLVAKDAVLKFSKPVNGARCYIAVSGGWKAFNWLNSYSTNLKIGLGGYHGRALKKGDLIESILPGTINENVLAGKSFCLLNETIDVRSLYNLPGKIRCTLGAEFSWLSKQAMQELFETEYTISTKSDRMGFQLEGSLLHTIKTESLHSSAVTKGTLQLLPSGKLIVLMADHQTTGGYPKVAHVINADISGMAQKAINEKIEFSLVDLQEAEDLFVAQQHHLNNLENKLHQQKLKHPNIL